MELDHTIQDLLTIWRNLEQEWENSRDNWDGFERRAFDNNSFQHIKDLIENYIAGVTALEDSVGRAITVLEE